MRILLVFALGIEAFPFIEKLNLKQTKVLSNIRVYESDKFVLVITGSGKILSSVATTWIFSQFNDISMTLNIGLCGSINHKIGDVVLIDQIIDNETNREYFPDVFEDGFERCSVMCKSIVEINNFPDMDICRDRFQTCLYVDVPNNKKYEPNQDIVYDMESVGFFIAANMFLQTHQIGIIKIVSDNLDKEKVDKENISKIIEENVENILQYVDKCAEKIGVNCKNIKIDYLNKYSDLLADYYFTQTQKFSLNNLLGDLEMKIGEKKTKSEIINFQKDIKIKGKDGGKIVLKSLCPLVR